VHREPVPASSSGTSRKCRLRHWAWAMPIVVPMRLTKTSQSKISTSPPNMSRKSCATGLKPGRKSPESLHSNKENIMSRLNPKRMLLGAGFAALMTGGALAQDRELVIAQGIDTPGFDIHNHSTSAVEAIHVNIFDYLVMRDQAGELQPALA